MTSTPSHRSGRGRSIVALLAAGALTASCQGGGSDAADAGAARAGAAGTGAPVAAVADDQPGGGATSAARTGAGVALPDDFPAGVPLPDGLIVIQAKESSPDHWEVGGTLDGSTGAEDVERLYAVLQDAGWDISWREESSFATGFGFTATRGAQSYRLLLPKDPAHGRANVSISLVV